MSRTPAPSRAERRQATRSRSQLLPRDPVSAPFPALLSGLFLAAFLVSCGDRASSPSERYVGDGPVVRLVGEVEAEPLEIETSRATALAGRSFVVELDHQLREAWAAAPGRAIVRRVAPAEGSRLDFALGVWTPEADAASGNGTEPAAAESPAPEGSARFTVTWWPGDVDEARARKGEQSAGSEAEVLFDETLPAAPGPRWSLRQVPLEGRTTEGTLVFEVETEGASDPRAFWGHPRILQPSAQRPRSVVLLSIDTLSARHLSLYGYPKPTSPQLDAWAEAEALVFENVVATSPWTLPSHRSLFTGLDAKRHGLNHDTGSMATSLGSRVTLPSLAERLREAGFLTAAETGGVYLHPKYGFAEGFEQYGSWPRPERLTQELPTILDRAREFLDAYGDLPFFLFLHTYDVHDPYRCEGERWPEITDLPRPEGWSQVAIRTPKNLSENGYRQVNGYEHRSAAGEAPLDDPALARACYDAGIARMDQKVGAFLRELSAGPVGERTIVALTSDHGEAFGHSPRVGHIQLYDENLLVPLLIADPDDRAAGQRVEQQVRLTDIMPTVLDMLDLPAPEGIDGHSLEPFFDGEEAQVPPYAWSYSASGNWGLSLRHSNRLKLILPNAAWAGARDGPELFDLRQDPDEGQNLVASGSEAERWVDLLSSDYMHRGVGLRLRIQNAGGGELSGALLGPMIRPLGTKSVDLDCACTGGCACLELDEIGKARLRVPGGTGFTLVLEKIFGNQLQVETRFEGREDRLSVRVDQLGEGRKLVWSGSGWQRSDGPLEPGETGFGLWWSGTGPVTSAPEEHDPELRRQLESLGYIQ